MPSTTRSLATRRADTGPIHPLDASYGVNVAAMMALVAGDFDQAEALARQALEVAQPHNELALTASTPRS